VIEASGAATSGAGGATPNRAEERNTSDDPNWEISSAANVLPEYASEEANKLNSGREILCKDVGGPGSRWSNTKDDRPGRPKPEAGGGRPSLTGL